MVRENIQGDLDKLLEKAKGIEASLDLPSKEAKLAELEKEMNAPTFWDNQDSAQKTVSEMKVIKAFVDPIRDLITEINDTNELLELAKEEGDDDTLEECDNTLTELENRFEKIEIQSLLSGKYDANNCFFTIYSGDGGTEANDWAEMMLRMYLYYFDKQGWKVEEVDRHDGEEVGLKDVTLHVSGPYANGYLSCERGTHRLARVSPFNAQGKRQTSFASVEVTPEIDEADVEIDENDLDIEFFARSSGPGGQNVNKVASACRIIHKPTGIAIVSSAERRQQQNKKIAMGILAAKLEQIELEKREAERLAAVGGKLEMGWGSQIRSYVIYDNRVKDTRTGYEMGNPARVLDGELQGFIEAELRRRQNEMHKSDD